MNWTRILLCVAAFLGAFLVTYWITEPEADPDLVVPFAGIKEAGERLARADASTHTELLAAARNAGLQSSSDFKGFVEQIRRVGEEAEMAGWVVDMRGIGEPTRLFVFAAGKLTGQTESKGERQDVTRVLDLTNDVKGNVSFSLRLRCQTGDVIRTIAVNPYGNYFALNSERCP